MRNRYRHTGEARSAFIRHRPQNCPRCVLTIRQSLAQQDHSKDTPTNCNSPYLQHLSPFRRAFQQSAAAFEVKIEFPECFVDELYHRPADPKSRAGGLLCEAGSSFEISNDEGVWLSAF